ncbi:MAG TPA: TetR/AcrR family transcriptional regulator [Rhizomicrobium sp.]|jgi:AcrR family transcriptional regulator|nr:TetR/AcrR family transcriptional regulator [Rhizomicrobium sp.]
MEIHPESPPESQARWRRRKEARRPEILEAALAVFAEKGLSAARMEDIAARAGITKGTIYLYFQSKDAVFKALLVETIGERVRLSTEMLNSFEGSTPDLLAAVLRIIGGFIAQSDRVVLLKLVIGEISKFPDLHRFYREQVVDRGMALWEAIIARGIARGEFRPLPPEHMARLCMGPILLAAIWRTLFAQFDDEPYDITGLIETHIDVLLRGLAADGGAP